MAILFYSTREKPYGGFSNFSAHPFELDGRRWPTSEHYFQAQKFAGTPHEEEVRRARGPMEAAAMGRERARPLRRDWEVVKDNVMRRAVLRKFETHAEICAILLSTGDEEIVENAPRDYYWGCGANGSGLNMLGKILMETRELLRRQADDGSVITDEWHTALVHLTNKRDTELRLYLESWGDVGAMPVGATYCIRAESPLEGNVEIEFSADSVTIWGWPRSTVAVTQNGAVIVQGRMPAPG